ncbi:hypothetical protein SSX86_009660 [Deinandra increscens subsp. villosa]|uniref:F-box domain-containing protein n=1 Tax=Deinandra increscens subsp. villosa TaxID=3103831 RepID=A0AAP0DE29_9ASTR
MKLRVRSFETKETLKVEIPNPCSLQNLRELVSQKLASPSLSSTIYFSLNRKDVLTTSSPEESIQSVGITSGDLIYYTTNINGFNTTPKSPSVAPSDSAPKPEQSRNPQTLIIPNSSKQDENSNPSSEKGETVDSSKSNPEEIDESMEIDDDESYVSEVEKSFSVPGFLRKVFTEELGDDAGLNHKLFGIAVRAVLLESGFVEIDPVSKSLKGNSYIVQGNWYLASFYYTLPNILTSGNYQAVKIKFQNIGKYCKVYGSLVNGTAVHSVLLDEDRLVPFLNVVWANCGQVEGINQATIQPEKEVFEFWRKVKDGLSLPLLIDLCEKAGLELPNCFMQLPTELKLKILESVSGVDIANVSCVCSELRYLASNDDLWKQKYIEQFGDAAGSEGGRTFKERFAKAWENQKRRRIVGRSIMTTRRRRNPYAPFGLGHFPRIIGGDYDLFPNIGPLGRPGGGGGPRLRNVMPNCDLGGLGR